jgi:hypothetical protein
MSDRMHGRKDGMEQVTLSSAKAHLSKSSIGFRQANRSASPDIEGRRLGSRQWPGRERGLTSTSFAP